MKLNARLYNFLNKLKTPFEKLYKTNDSPQKISLGVGLGVFLGILPGTGPLAALLLATLLRVNRAAAILGSILTNTWINFVTFLLAAKLGSAILKTDWEHTQQQCRNVFEHFRFTDLFEVSFLKIVLPIAIGYLIIGFILACGAYIIALITIKVKRREDKSRAGIPA